MELEDNVAILGQLYNAGYDGSKAGNALRSAFATLLNPVGQAADVIEEFSLDITRLNPETNDFADILDYLSDAGFGTTEMFKLFGLEAAPAISALLEKTDGIRELGDALENSVGASAVMASQKLDTLSGSTDLLKSALEGVAITIGKALAPYVRAFVEWMTAMVPVVMKLGGALKEKLMPSFLKLRDFLADVIPQVKALAGHLAEKLQPAFKSVKKIVDSLGKIFGELTSNLGSNKAAFVTLTVVADIVATVLNTVAGAIAAVIGWFAKHPTITKFVAVALAAFVLINPLFLALTSTIGLITAALALLAVAWDKDWLGIKTTTIAVTAAISKVISGFLDAITAFWDAHGKAIMKTVSFIWDAIGLNIKITMAAITAVISVAMALIQGDWEGAWDGHWKSNHRSVGRWNNLCDRGG